MRCLLVAVVLFGLAGCGSAHPEPQRAPSAAVETSDAATAEDLYIAQIAETVPDYVINPGRERFIELGYEACQTLANGSMNDNELVITWADVQGIERIYATTALAAAKEYLC